MNSIFGDATTIAPTPETLAEAESLFSGNRSPIGSFSLAGNNNDDNVPDIALQPPDVEIRDGKAMLSTNGGEGEGVGGWISKMVKSTKGESENGGSSGRYARVGQEDEQGDERDVL